jgi:hypothetical protein
MTTLVRGGEIEQSVAGWQQTTPGKKKAPRPPITRERFPLKIRSEGEREHVARLTRHVAGLS